MMFGGLSSLLNQGYNIGWFFQLFHLSKLQENEMKSIFEQKFHFKVFCE